MINEDEFAACSLTSSSLSLCPLRAPSHSDLLTSMEFLDKADIFSLGLSLYELVRRQKRQAH